MSEEHQPFSHGPTSMNPTFWGVFRLRRERTFIHMADHQKGHQKGAPPLALLSFLVSLLFFFFPTSFSIGSPM